MTVRLDHIVLNVRDIPSSIQFYSRILQFEVERLDQFEAGAVPFPSVRIDSDTVIDLFPPKMWDMDKALYGDTKNLNHFCLAMSAIEWNELRERLSAAGIELHRDRSKNWGAKGEGTSMYFFDPDGNEIEARFYGNE
jgi:catechol 2,3-dioxygenase-like lactoylglutathione lyase family enzyme